jgi:hypothetical protein
MDKVAVALCACGCGVEVKNKWVRGHHSRVNNISKRNDVREKRRQNFVEMHAEGKFQPWNKGLTTEDPRVAANGLARSRAYTPEQRQIRSASMSAARKNGTIPTLRGPRHSQWKGGVSRIAQRMRGSHQLYKSWKLPILQRDRFLCCDCGRGSPKVKLQVHHDREKFGDIVQRCLFSLFPDTTSREMTFDEVTIVIDAVVQYHTQNDVSGRTLCEQCHSNAHSAA